MHTMQNLLIGIIRNPLVDRPVKLQAAFLFERLRKQWSASGSFGAMFDEVFR